MIYMSRDTLSMPGLCNLTIMDYLNRIANLARGAYHVYKQGGRVVQITESCRSGCLILVQFHD